MHVHKIEKMLLAFSKQRLYSWLPMKIPFPLSIVPGRLNSASAASDVGTQEVSGPIHAWKELIN